jgi:hypothetical protein
VPAAVAVHLPDHLYDLVIVDPAVVGTDKGAQLARLALLRAEGEDLDIFLRFKMAESRLQGARGEEGATGNRGDLPKPAGRSTGDCRELAQGPVGEIQAPDVALVEGEAAGRLALSFGNEARVCDDIASGAPGALKGCRVKIGQGEVALIRRTTEPFG